MVTAFLSAFSPTVLAYGHLITPDIGASALGVAAAYLFWRWLRSPAWPRTVAAGLVLGLAELTKTTWLVLFALWPLIWFVGRCAGSWISPERSVRCEGLRLFVIILLAVWVLNFGYLFEGSFKPLGDFAFVSRALGGNTEVVRSGYLAHNRFADSWLGKIPVPLPENYVRGIDLQKLDFENGMASYLNGEWRHGGWWYYYLYAMLVKEPLGTWGLGLLSVVVMVRWRRYAAAWRDELFLLAPAVAVIVLVSSQTGFNHHLRYVLPAFPFLFISMSKVARSINFGHWKVAGVGGVLLGWSIFSSLSVYPHSLSYFNELAGGPKGGHWHLSNSNTDWGQDLLYLKRWLDAHPEATAEGPIGLVYDLPLIDPRQAGIDWRGVPTGPSKDQPRSADSIGPLPGWYAISVNRLHSWGGEYNYFLEFEPVGMAGYSIYLYHITPAAADRVRAKLGVAPVGAGGPAAGATATTRSGAPETLTPKAR